MKIIEIAGYTDIGKQRNDNQDTFICKQLWSVDDALLAVIDGVGGYAGGEIAANIAKESIIQYMSSPKGDILTMLREAVVFANNKIVEERQKNVKLSQMCCVLTVAVADAKTRRLFYVHVGDTRLYCFREEVLEKLTKDHSMVGIREDAGELNEAEAMGHPRRNEIMREVGSIIHRIDDPEFLDYGETTFAPGDLFLICSDGLSDMLTRSQMVSVLDKEILLEEKADKLIALANQQGGNDNITLVLAKNLSEVLSESTSYILKKTPDPSLTELSKRPHERQPFPVQQKSASLSKYKRIILAVLIVIVVIGAAAGWFWWKQPEKFVAESGNKKDTTVSTRDTKPGKSDMQYSLDTARIKPGKHLILKEDTITLSETIILSDSIRITGKSNYTVFKSADGSRAQFAFRVTSNSKTIFENVIISGFEGGISMEKNVSLQLKNVLFKNVITPVRAGIKYDSVYNEQINFSSTIVDSAKKITK